MEVEGVWQLDPGLHRFDKPAGEALGGSIFLLIVEACLR